MRHVLLLTLGLLAGCSSYAAPGEVPCPVVNDSIAPVVRRCVDPRTGAVCYTRGEALACVRVTQ
jgi:hypothetical protein